MVQINKTGKRPTILVSRGADKGKDRLLLETEKLKAEYLSEPIAYNSGKKKFEFDSDLYAHTNIKSALIHIQHGKCCFCESNITHIAYGDVEHFRPKKAWTTTSNRKYNYPGYYWLAYDWNNLFLACQMCNQRFKRNLFPLVDESKRALNHTYNLADEEPLFIHPESINPELHITFEGAFIKPKNASIKGETTIKRLNLERIELFERRLEIYEAIKLLIRAYYSIPHKIPEDALKKSEIKAYLKKKLNTEQEYLNMIKSNFGNEIQKILNDAV